MFGGVRQDVDLEALDRARHQNPDGVSATGRESAAATISVETLTDDLV